MVVDGDITATREDVSGTLRRPVYQVCALGIPDLPTRQAITRLCRMGLAHLNFRERVGRFVHYRVEPTQEGELVFRVWGILPND